MYRCPMGADVYSISKSANNQGPVWLKFPDKLIANFKAVAAGDTRSDYGKHPSLIKIGIAP
jgi:hypothetical protein